MTYHYPNVKLDAPMLSVEGKVTSVPPFIGKLVDEIVVKYPTWLLEGCGRRVGETKLEVIEFKVLNDANPREHVGTIREDRRYTQHGQVELVYVLRGKRLAQDRERGDSLRTKDIKVALKAVKKYFTPPPAHELLDDVHELGVRAVYECKRSTRNKLLTLNSSLMPEFFRFAKDHLPSFTATLDAAKKLEMVALIDVEEDSRTLDNLQTHINQGKVLTVLMQDDKYMVRYEGAVSLWESEKLPAEVRGRIGRLKLTEVNTIVSDVGVRTDKGFIILLPEDFSFTDKNQ